MCSLPARVLYIICVTRPIKCVCDEQRCIRDILLAWQRLLCRMPRMQMLLELPFTPGVRGTGIHGTRSYDEPHTTPSPSMLQSLVAHNATSQHALKLGRYCFA